MLQQLLSRLGGGGEAKAFLEELTRIADSECQFRQTITTRMEVVSYGRLTPWRSPYAYDWRPEELAESRHWIAEQRAKLLSRYPQGDQLALHWLTDPEGYRKQVDSLVKLVQGRPIATRLMLSAWVASHPADGAAEHLEQYLQAYLRADRQSRSDVHAKAMEALCLMDRPEATGAIRSLLAEAAPILLACGPDHQAPSYAEADHLCAVLPRPLLQSGQAGPAEAEAFLLALPRAAASRSDWFLPAERKEWWDGLIRQLISGYLQRYATGQMPEAIRRIILDYEAFRGFDQLAAICRQLVATPPPKPGSDEFWGHPSRWAVRALWLLSSPTPADPARSGELAGFDPETLLLVALYAPRWGRLVESYLDWPGLTDLVTWLRGSTTKQPFWDAQAPQDEEEESITAREAVIAAVSAMGEKRLAKLKKHPHARHLYADAFFLLDAVLGRNAADVEARFLKRQKKAVIALALLPDEGDILQRYLALRRFAKEAKQFGAQRQASEQRTVEAALSTLAVTAGFDETAQLEWAMEAQLAKETGGAERTWTIGEYRVHLAASESAAIIVHKDGKRLKSVPPAVRQAAAYSEITEAHQQLKDQWERIQRRLELAMALGEEMDRQSFAPVLTTPAGRALLPGLLLRCWISGEAEPVELLHFARLDGTPIDLDLVERFQVIHPLQLENLQAWQARLAQLGIAQPFPQLFRERYPSPAPDPREGLKPGWLMGRKVRNGALKERLKRRGWRPDYEADFYRRLPGRIEVSLGYADGASYMEATEVLTIGVLHFYGPGGWGSPVTIDPLLLSEALRDADLATYAAAADRVTLPPSPAVMTMRQELAIALGASVEGEAARAGGYGIHLATGGVTGPDGAAVALPELKLPDPFPYPAPDPDTATIMARVCHLLQAERRSRK